VNRGDQILQRCIALRHQRRIQSRQRADVVGVIGTEPPRVAAPMLLMALVRRDERVGRQVAGGEIRVEPMRAVKGHHVLEADAGVIAVMIAVNAAFLHAPEIDERIVFGRIETDGMVTGCRFDRFDQRPSDTLTPSAPLSGKSSW
jgi:hypothetical protein